MSDRDFISTGEFIAYPDDEPAEVIETVAVLDEDPTADAAFDEAPERA